MRTAYLVVGAALLVAGAALIAFAPFYTNMGFFKAELKSTELEFNSSSTASSAMLSTYSSYADAGELIALAGVIIAPIGGALLGYGLSAEPEWDAKRAGPTTEPPLV